MEPAERADLRAVLLDHAPWLDRADAGPRAVDAGECDRCGEAPRLLPTCGPVPWTALCRVCAAAVGPQVWCDGHRDLADDLLRWSGALPDDWADVTRLWWLATGEVRPGR